MDAASKWAHLVGAARRITSQYPDAVFIGGVAVYHHALRLGSPFLETSHDADFYISLTGKAALRDRYEMQRNPHLGKDSALIEGEDMDVYVERQHRLGIPYDRVSSYAEEIEGVRVAALEHLLVLKLDAAIDRAGTDPGEKDIRDTARILALLTKPRSELLSDLLTEDRLAKLREIVVRRDLGVMLHLNAHESSRFAKTIRANADETARAVGGPERG